MKQSTATDRSRFLQLDDNELIEQARNGHEFAFRIIMERHNRRLYRVARALLKDETEAEDVVQQAYLRAFTALASFRNEASLATWLTRITINQALGRKRKERPTVELEAVQEKSAEIIRFPTMNSDTDPERAAAQREIRRLLEASIDRLPEA